MAAGMKVQIVVKCNHLGACSGAMATGIRDAFNTLGPQLLTTMQGKTPVDTGELKASESMSVGDKQLTLTAGTDHAIYPEFGTRYMAAEPYMRPTIEGAAGTVGSAIAAGVGPALAAQACG